MSSSPLSGIENVEVLKLLQSQQTAEVQEYIRDTLYQVAMSFAIPPEGLAGHIDMALKVDRKKLVIGALRETADRLEKSR